jgi:hypothetical protein
VFIVVKFSFFEFMICMEIMVEFCYYCSVSSLVFLLDGGIFFSVMEMRYFEVLD